MSKSCAFTRRDAREESQVFGWSSDGRVTMIAAIIQARMSSTRLPGKVLLDLGGETVLARVVRRLRRAKLIDEIVVATTNSAADNSIVRECEGLSVRVFRGDEHDVLDRYYHAAHCTSAEGIVRITSDCPLIDPEITDNTIRWFLEHRPDYASNALQRTYPRGLDTEVMTREALACAWREARLPYQRAHVTPYIYENPDRFDILPVKGEVDHSGHRWTLDTAEDLAFIRAVYDCVGNDDRFSWHDILALVEREPELTELNRDVVQKALHEG
jgi:spore coat polysaccharide biosynthesis protein SpsF